MAAPTRELLTYFDELHRARFDGLPAVIAGGKDAKIMATLWKSHELYVRPLMARFFAEKGQFQERAGFTVGVFRSQFSRLLIQYQKQERLTVAADDWFDECKRLHGGTCPARYQHEHQKDMDAMRRKQRKAAS